MENDLEEANLVYFHKSDYEYNEDLFSVRQYAVLLYNFE